MARRTPPRRSKPRDAGRRGKKKISALVIGKVDYVDYKDAELLRKFVSERSKLKARRVTGNSEQQQREVARAVKNAREMALIPYTNRVTTQRRERRNDERGPRADGPPPRPSGPPSLRTLCQTMLALYSKFQASITASPSASSALGTHRYRWLAAAAAAATGIALMSSRVSVS